jgi:DNA-binding NarL/FixJ family response regulator
MEGCRLANAADQRATAARLASWLAREYALLGNLEAASGWMTRATHLGRDEPDVAGWVALAEAMCAADVTDQRTLAESSLAAARRGADVDLEIMALARSGLALIRTGVFGDGLARFDEALALATGGEATRLRTVGEACCDLVLATELTGDVQRFARWMGVVGEFVDRRGYPAILGFCSTCCAAAETIEGDFAGAEQQLRAAVVSLHETGHTARCVPPAAKLAELLVLQGRFEEAEQLLGDDESAEAQVARAHLALANGDTSLAISAASRAARRIAGDSLVKAAAQAALVDASIADGDLEAADRAAAGLTATAQTAGSARALSRASVARGKVALARGEDRSAVALFEEALDHLAGASGSIESAEAHLALARLHAPLDEQVARAEARAALRIYESVGATRGADAAAAMLRGLGDRSRVGPKGLELLTQREWEVLRLLGQGLTNAEIAQRLYISVKTAGNHVSSILSKLNLRSRVEAARFALLHPQRP